VRATIAAPVSRTVRRILSGAPDGQPDWVRELAEPGDAGWFGPGSSIWSVHGSLATLVGGIRALLIQSLHPLALAGVQDHSDYRSDALGRLQRTNRWLTSVTFGSSTQADRAIRRVQGVHERVSGTAADGRAYAANDPFLLRWVHIGLADSMLVAAQTFGPRDVDPDEYVAEMAVVGRRMGVQPAPNTVAALSADFAAFRPDLRGGPGVDDVVRFLARPPLPAVALPAYSLLYRSAVDLVPEWAHPLLGTEPRPLTLRTVDLLGTSTLLGGLRAVLGRQSPAERAASRRCGTNSARPPRATTLG
jgi:uncharacterized protein (DUF2236 family)